MNEQEENWSAYADELRLEANNEDKEDVEREHSEEPVRNRAHFLSDVNV